MSCEGFVRCREAEVLVDCGELGVGVSVAGVMMCVVVTDDSAELDGGGGKKGVASSMMYSGGWQWVEKVTPNS